MENTPKFFKSYTFILQKVKKPLERFFTDLIFDSAIILIFCGLFLYMFSRLLKVNINWIRVPTTNLTRQKNQNKEGESKFR